MKHKLLGSLLLIIALILGQWTPVFAKAGDLDINNHVIEADDDQKKIQTNTAYKEVPDIFLKKRSQIQKNQEDQTKSMLKTAKTDNFASHSKLDQTSYQKTVGPKIDFSKSKSADQLDETPKQSMQIPLWIILIFSGMILIGAGYIGIYLGRKYARFYRRS